MTRPDFCIIGGMKCGTTTLAYQLGEQDGVFMTDPKEPNFFSDEEIFAQGLDWYADLFAGAGGALKGEASTHYTKWPTHPDAPKRFAEYAPEAKLIYMVREPVSRALSHMRHAWTQREMVGDFETAAREMDIFWQYGLYERQLSQWLELYPQERVMVVALERLNRDPQGEFSRVLKFLGVEGAWVHGAEEQNQGADRSRKLPMHNLIVDNPVAAKLRQILVPKWVRTKIREGRQLKALDVSDEAKARFADNTRDDLRQFGERFGMVGLSPETFKEKVLAQQLTFAEKSDS